MVGKKKLLYKTLITSIIIALLFYSSNIWSEETVKLQVHIQEKQLPIIKEKFCSYIQSQYGAGDYQRYLQFDGRNRFYDLHIPQKYDKEKVTAVVLVFHGGSGNPVQQRNDSQMDGVSDKYGFIVVYPAGTGKLEDKFLTFNSGNGFGYAKENNIDDVGWTKALLNDVETLFNVDKTKIYATGMSNGAFMCYRLAFELSDRIAVFALVSGVLGVEPSNYKLSRPVSIIHFHGKEDQHILYDGGIGPKAFAKISQPSVSETIQFWVNHNDCSKESIKETRIGKAVCTVYSLGRENSEVVLWTLEDGGHTWPGGKSTLLESEVGKINTDIFASELMWQFFEKHPQKQSETVGKNTYQTFSIIQNYPNPFNPECYIPYTIRHQTIDIRYQMVKIRIYNILGQLVKELDLGLKQAGSYITKDKAAYWDGRNAQGKEIVSGVYFYELVVNNKITETKKTLVLK